MASKKKKESFFTLEHRIINGEEKLVRVKQEGQLLIDDDGNKYFVLYDNIKVAKLVDGETGMIIDTVVYDELTETTDSVIINYFKEDIKYSREHWEKDIKELLTENNITIEQIKDLKEVKE